MPTSTPDKTPAAPAKHDGEGNAEVQAKMDEALAKGYIGVVPDPIPNSAYSLQSGPDSPPVIDDNQTRFAQTHAVTSKEKPNA